MNILYVYFNPLDSTKFLSPREDNAAHILFIYLTSHTVCHNIVHIANLLGYDNWLDLLIYSAGEALKVYKPV